VTEYDLQPGTYTAFCFIADAATGMPHLLEGMFQSFTVNGAEGEGSPQASPGAG
jgi:hypothetical protein